jgi:hypothetical protein
MVTLKYYQAISTLTSDQHLRTIKNEIGKTFKNKDPEFEYAINHPGLWHPYFKTRGEI